MTEKLRRKLEHLTNKYLNEKIHLLTSYDNLKHISCMENTCHDINGRINVLSTAIKDIRIILEETK